MALLEGIAEGLMGAGQTVGRGLFAQAQMMQQDERERLRQASIDKRWAREDVRQAKMDKRYEDKLGTESERYKDTQKFREGQAKTQASREGRQAEKQDATLLGQALDRLDKMKRDKAKELLAMFKDPMTGTVTDQAGYNNAMSALQQSYQEDAAQLVQRSGFGRDQIDKYGFGMFLPEETDTTHTMPDGTEMAGATHEDLSAPAPAASGGFDIGGWASKARGGTDAGTPKPITKMPGDMSRQENAVDYLLNERGQVTRKPGLMSPENIEQQNEFLKGLRSSNIQSGYGASMMPR